MSKDWVDHTHKQLNGDYIMDGYVALAQITYKSGKTIGIGVEETVFKDMGFGRLGQMLADYTDCTKVKIFTNDIELYGVYYPTHGVK